jgi:hypothetical protein
MLNEAGALKNKLSGLIIKGEDGADLEVPVWFRNPENEIRDMTFPSIVMEYGAVSKASDREHRAGRTYLGYIPEEYGPGPVQTLGHDGLPRTFDTTQDFDPTTSPFMTYDYPIPYNIDFTLTVYTRFENQLLPIVGALGKIDRIPVRFGYLEVSQDGTVRSMDLMAGPEIVPERDAAGKRVFRAVYSVRVASELALHDVYEIGQRINSVHLDVKRFTSVS